MRTAIIFWEDPDDMKYFIAEGDYTHLNDVHINAGIDIEKEEEVNTLISDLNLITLQEFRQTLLDENTNLILCGFIS